MLEKGYGEKEELEMELSERLKQLGKLQARMTDSPPKKISK